jgi:hypothetical protein
MRLECLVFNTPRQLLQFAPESESNRTFPVRVRFGSTEFLKCRFDFGSVRFGSTEFLKCRFDFGSVRFGSTEFLKCRFEFGSSEQK